MVRLYLFAEGPTEQTFADNLLKPHLSQYEVLLHNPILIAHARKKGKVHRGGGRNYLAMKNDIQRLLRQEKAPDVFFTTMIDLSAISAQFPGLSESDALRQNPSQRVEFLEQRFAEDIGDDSSPTFNCMNTRHIFFATPPVLSSFMIIVRRK